MPSEGRNTYRKCQPFKLLKDTRISILTDTRGEVKKKKERKKRNAKKVSNPARRIEK